MPFGVPAFTANTVVFAEVSPFGKSSYTRPANRQKMFDEAGI
jgi:hypothetical protein